jgi:glycosyltransferase involved in cell wall biosynthesis
LAREAAASVVFHIDDDLLNVPSEIGKRKYEYHNHPFRLSTVRYLLSEADLVYCSTSALRQRIGTHGSAERYVVGRVYCASDILVPVENRVVRKIGYMGFDHAHDFELALPAVVETMRAHQDLQFDLFGSIPKPAALDEFGARVNVIEPVANYGDFMKRFADLSWDIGICPLADTDFNVVKANTKWVEYTAVGAAVIASRGTVYDDCCADGCGILAGDSAEWTAALQTLVADEHARAEFARKAQAKLANDYSLDVLRRQVLDVLTTIGGFAV